MDSDLDSRLAAAAPLTVQRTVEVRRELDALVAEAEATRSPAASRLRRRVGVTSLVAAGVLGMGAAASAAGIWAPPGWLRADSTLSSGTPCQIAYGVNLSGEPANLESVSSAVQAATLAAARAFIAHFDVSTIPVDDAVIKYKAEASAERAAELRQVPGHDPCRTGGRAA